MSYGFSGGQTSDKVSLYKKLCSSLFILDNRKKQTFYLKDNIHNGKLWLEVIIIAPMHDYVRRVNFTNKPRL